MSGHRHNPTAGTQNQGNTLGDRSCVRQSKLYRMYESGNGVKSILGTPHLCWDPNQKEGAYAGHQVYDHTRDNPFSTESNSYGNSSRNNVGYSKQGSGRGSYDDDDYQQPSRRQPQQSLKNYAGGGNNNNDYNYDNHENYPSNNNIYGGGGPAYGSGSMMSTYQAEYVRSNSGRSNYSGRRDESNDSGDSYPLNKMRSDDRGSGNNASYRNMKEQQAMNGNASSFQSLRTNSKEKVAERVARSYFNNNNGGGNMDSGRGGGGANDRDRSTRPW